MDLETVRFLTQWIDGHNMVPFVGFCLLLISVARLYN